MRYHELISLDESLNRVVPYTWEDFSNDDAKVYEATFQIGDGTFIVKFKSTYLSPDWTVSFTRNGTYDLTGTGSAGTVMATVMQVTRDFVRNHDPRVIGFDTKNEEASRTKLYPKLMALLQREFPQYSDAAPRRGRKHTSYRLERPRAPFKPVPPPPPREPEKPITQDEWDEIEAMLLDRR